MREWKQAYLQKLRIRLKDHPAAEEIVEEYATFIEDKTADLTKGGATDAEIEKKVMEAVPAPEELARQFKETKAYTGNQVMGAVAGVNVAFLGTGAVLTWLYHRSSSPVIQYVWTALAEMHWVILFAYSAFMLQVGYLIGKEFGARFNKQIKNILAVMIAPNMMFMIAVLYTWIPHAWFAPMLTAEFLAACIFMTLLYYPLGRFAYRAGRLSI